MTKVVSVQSALVYAAPPEATRRAIDDITQALASDEIGVGRSGAFRCIATHWDGPERLIRRSKRTPPGSLDRRHR